MEPPDSLAVQNRDCWFSFILEVCSCIYESYASLNFKTVPDTGKLIS